MIEKKKKKYLTFKSKKEKNIAQKWSFPLNDFFSKFEQIRNFLRICVHLLNKSSMENFIFCAVYYFI